VALQSLVGLHLFQKCLFPILEASKLNIFLRYAVVSPTPNSQLVGPG
jgi:hypothetical protein